MKDGSGALYDASKVKNAAADRHSMQDETIVKTVGELKFTVTKQNGAVRGGNYDMIAQDTAGHIVYHQSGSGYFGKSAQDIMNKLVTEDRNEIESSVKSKRDHQAKEEKFYKDAAKHGINI
jgi:hypothetical protein